MLLRGLNGASLRLTCKADMRWFRTLRAKHLLC